MSDMTDKEKQEQIEQAPCPKEEYLLKYFGIPEFNKNLPVKTDLGDLCNLLYMFESQWQQQQAATLSDATLNELIRDLLDYAVEVDHADIDEMRKIARKHLKT